MRFRQLKAECSLPVARQFVASYPDEILAKLKKLPMANPLFADRNMGERVFPLTVNVHTLFQVFACLVSDLRFPLAGAVI